MIIKNRIKKPPLNHPNKKLFNALIYKINRQALLQFSGNFKGTLYDFGCGDMTYREYLLQFADNYIGVDWTNTFHELKADIIADLNEPRLPIDDQVADTIVSLSVLEHLCEPQNMINESFRILKPEGRLILQVPFMWGMHEAPYDYYRYTCYGLSHMLKKAGFVDIQITPTTGFWVMLILKFNYQSNRLIRGPWILRKVIGVVLYVVWTLDQTIALWLDKYWKCETETTGYNVVARKP